MKKKHVKKVGKKILGRAFWVAEVPAAVKYLKRARHANLKAKPRKASIKHLGIKHKTLKGKAEANIKTRKIVGPSSYYLGFGKGGAIKKVGKEVMSYVGKKVHKKKPVVKKPVTKKSTNPYSLADWKQGIKHKGKGYSKGGAIKKGITIIVDPKGRAKIKESVKQAKERGEKELEDFIKNLNPKKFQSGGLVKPKSVRIAKRGWGKAIR